MGSRTTGPPPESPILPIFARFLPKTQEKTPFVVVDKRGFFSGRSDWIRTSAALPSRIVERETRHSRVSRSPCFVGYRCVKTAHRAVFACSPLVPGSGPNRRRFEPGTTDKEASPRTRRGEASLVGVTGFEPAASWSRTKRSTKLSHTPVFNFRKGYYNTGKVVCQAETHKM